MSKSFVTRREFGRMVGAGILGAATIADGQWTRPDAAATGKRLAVIGCGRRGACCVDALQGQGASVAFVCDSNASRGVALASQTRAAFTAQWMQCLKSNEITDVIVALPTALTVDVCSAALEHGKGVFLDCSQGVLFTPLLTTVCAKGTRNVSGMLPHTPAAAAARTCINDGAIGAVRFAHSSRGSCDVNQDACAVAEAHSAQLLFLFDALGLQREDYARSVATSNAHDCFQTIMTSISREDGTRLEVCSAAAPVVGNGCVIQGDRGSIRFVEGRIEVIREDGAAQVVNTRDDGRIRTAALRHWLHENNSDTSFCRPAALTASIMNDARRRISERVVHT